MIFLFDTLIKKKRTIRIQNLAKKRIIEKHPLEYLIQEETREIMKNEQMQVR